MAGSERAVRAGTRSRPWSPAAPKGAVQQIRRALLGLLGAAQHRRVTTGAFHRGDRRTVGGRSVPALNDVARAVVFGDCIRVQMTARSRFASIWIKAKVEKHPKSPTVWFFILKPSRSRMLRPPIVRRSPRCAG